MISIDRKKRGIVIVVLIVLTAAFFWTQSRYPDLNRKAMMAEAASPIGDVSPWPVIQVKSDAPFIEKWFYTTVNWAHANRKGMAFGIVIAALVLTLTSYFPLARRAGRLQNAAIGVAVGTPLGLCVNCAAPVFKSALRTGRVETAFALMLSSPTLNIVVLTMLFSLFPFYMAVVKVLTTLLCVFVAVPLISRWLGDNHVLRDLPQTELQKITDYVSLQATQHVVEPWLQAIYRTLWDILRKLTTLALRLVPLMLFAGGLGAVMVLTIPTSSLAGYDGIGAILLSAFIGVLLPVPVAFDLMLVSSLASQGLPPAVVLTLLCTLGSFSILAFLFVITSASRQWAFALLGLYFVVGALAGTAANAMHEKFFIAPQLAKIDSAAAALTSDHVAANANSFVVTSAQSATPALTFDTIYVSNGMSIARTPFAPTTLNSAPPKFVQHEGPELGITGGFRYGVRDYSDPFWIGRGTAAGDFNGDGWQDIALGSNDGVELYINRGGTFESYPLQDADDNHLMVYAVAFVDFDNDGALDLFITTFNHGNFVIYNRGSRFNYAQRLAVPNNKAVLTVSPAFADIDGNGLLDVVNGNMALGVVTGSHQMSAGRANSLVFNGGAELRDVALENDSGETMSTLVSDLNDDGIPDIVFSNDFIVADKVLLGTGAGFKAMDASSGFIAKTPYFSMSADTGDFNNDLKLDFMTMGTTGMAKGVGTAPIDGVAPSVYTQSKWQPQTCAGIQDSTRRQQCEKIRNSDFLAETHPAKQVEVEQCKALGDPHEVQGCLLVAMWHLITNNAPAGDCAQRFGPDPLIQQVCEILRARERLIVAGEAANAIEQVDKNLVYRFDGQHLVDINADSAKAFDHPGGWTWNGKFVDVDNDGWQDVFNADGAVRKGGYGWNVFMKNVDGKRFEKKQFSYNLVDDFGLYSFVLVDINNDGALDIVGNGAVGPVRVFENKATGSNQSIAVSLIDHHGNRFGVGAKIYISYSDGTQQQMREIKAGGGYLSFDAPVAYFGLGEAQAVTQIRVRWCDGSETVHEGPFAAGYQYRITRG